MRDGRRRNEPTIAPVVILLEAEEVEEATNKEEGEVLMEEKLEIETGDVEEEEDVIMKTALVTSDKKVALILQKKKNRSKRLALPWPKRVELLRATAMAAALICSPKLTIQRIIIPPIQLPSRRLLPVACT